MADLSALNGISQLYSGPDDEKHSDAGWEWESAKSGYQSGLWAVPAALGNDYAMERFIANKERSDYASSMSESPKSLEEVLQRQESGDYGMDVGGKLGYLRNLAIGSAPYALEFVGTGFGLGALGKRAASGVAERVAASAAERALATGASRETAIAAGESAVNSAFRTGGGVVGSYPSSVGDILGNQYDQSGQFDAASAAALGVPYAALNAVGIEGALTRGIGGRLAGGRLANALAQGGKLALSEGVGETGQEVSNQVGRYAVDNSYDPFGEEARKAYLESFAGGALLGGLPGGAVGAMQKRPLDSGSDLLSGRNPAREAFDRAAAADVIQQRRSAPVNENGTIQVTPSGDALIDPIQVQAYNQFGANAQAQQAAAQPQQSQQEQLSPEIQQIIFNKYGAPTPKLGASGEVVGQDFHGTTHLSPEAVNAAVLKLAKSEGAKKEELHHMEQSLADAYRTVMGTNPTAKFVDGLVTKLGLKNAPAAPIVLDKIDLRLPQIEKAKGAKVQLERDVLTEWKSQLGGQNVSQNVQNVQNTAPNVQNTMQQGATNGLQTQEVQDPAQAQVNATQPNQLAPQAVQAQATQVTETGAQDAAAVAEVRAREAWDEETVDGDPKFDELSPEAKQEWAVSVLTGKNTGELMQQLVDSHTKPEQQDSATKAEIVQSLFNKVFGARDAEIMQLAIQKEMTQEQIGKQFGMSKSNVQKILARANPANLQRLIAEAKAVGMTEEDLRAAMSSEAADTTTDGQELEEGYNEADKDTTGLAEETDFAGATADLVGDSQGVLDNNDLFGSENGATQSMKIRKSANDSEISVAARTVGEDFIKAAESGDTKALEKVQKQFAEMEATLKALNAEKAKAKTKEARQAIELRIDAVLAKFAKSGKATTVDTKVDGDNVTLHLADIKKLLSEVPGILNGIKQLIAQGQDAVFGDVKDYYVYSSGKQDECAFVAPHPDGGYLMAFNLNSVGKETDNWNAHIARHEFAHIADDAHGARRYSADPELKVTSLGKKLLPSGGVATELHDLYTSGSELGQHFAYPFDTNKHKLPKNRAEAEAIVQCELFAQLYSAYTDPVMRVQLEAAAPTAAQLMEGVLDGIRQRSVSEASSGAREDGSRGQDQARNQRATRNAPEQRVYGKGSGRDANVGSKRTAAGKNEGLSSRQGAVEKKIAKLPEPVRGPVQRVLDNFFNYAKKGVYGFAFTKDLVDIAAKALPSSTNYVKLMERKGAVARAHENAVENIVSRYESLSSDERGTGANSVNRFIHDSTRTGKWGYKIKQDATITLDSEFKARFEKFSPQAQEVIKAVFKHGYDTLQQKKQLVRAEINSEFDGILSTTTDVKERRQVEAQRRAKLKQFDSLMSIEANKPYAPLKRFGNYVVVAKSKAYMEAEDNNDVEKVRQMQSDENEYYVQFADTIGEAKQIRDEIAGGFDYSEAFEKNAARDALYGGQEMFTAFQKLKSLVVEQFGAEEADNKSLRAINRMVSDLYLSTLAEASARKSETRRRKVAGADLDMMRAFATQGRADAHFIGSLLYSSEVNKSLEGMMSEAGERAPGREERARLMNEFLMRHAGSMDWKSTRVQDAIQRATSLYMLAFSPSYYMQNLTQTAMMSMPVIAGRHGYAASSAAITDAYNQLAPMLKGTGIARRMNFEAVPAEMRKLIQTLVERGVLDVGIDQDLGSFRSGGEGVLSRSANKVDRFLRSLPQKVEAINRVSTALAAYNLEMKKNGGNEQAATDYAEQIINTTHGDYSGFNAPRYMQQAPWGKVLFQFRKFQLIQLSLMVRLTNDAFRNSSAEERWAAKKALGYLVGQTALVGGVMGLPGFAAVAWAMGLFFGDDDTPDNPELTLRQMIGDKDLADMILHGAPTAVGIDLSGKLGMGQMLSILPFSDIDLSSRSGYEKTATAMLGPFFGGVVPRMSDAVGYMGNGDYFKAVETALPIGLGNVLKAYRVGTEGMTNKQNDEVMSADEFDFAKQVAIAMGVPVMDVTHKNFVQKAQIQYDEYFKDQAANIKHRYVKAARSGEATGELVQEWNKLQDTRARVGYTRQKTSDLLKAPMEQAKRERGVAGGVETSKANQGFVRQVAGFKDGGYVDVQEQSEKDLEEERKKLEEESKKQLEEMERKRQSQQSSQKGGMPSVDPTSFAGSATSSGGEAGVVGERGGGAMANGAETSTAGATESSGFSASDLGMGGGTGVSYASAAGGAFAGYMAGRKNYETDPNMSNHKDGYGDHHKDYRAEVGGGVLGGVMGYYGGPVGAALAYPTVRVVHKWAEPATRSVINAGDKVGGSGGALMVDPIGTVASGKYSWSDLGKGALLGPAKKWLHLSHGGKVDGPGTATSDSIPARLSDGEYVLNAEAVKLIGKDKLDHLNGLGLKARRKR